MHETFWLQEMMSGLPACYYSVKAFSETDLTEDLKAIDVPTLIILGDDNQIVPIKASALPASGITNNAPLIVYEGGSHGRPPPAMREWAVRLKGAPGTAQEGWYPDAARRRKVDNQAICTTQNISSPIAVPPGSSCSST